MKFIPISICLALVSAGSSGWAQAEISPSDLVRSALTNSPKVQAGVSETEALRNRYLSLKSGFNPKLEVAPGVGFTNSNAIISQELDIFGKRNTEALVAEREVSLGEAKLAVIRNEVAYDSLAGYVDLLSAQEQLRNAEAALASAEAIRDAVKRQEEIGKVPAVQVTRAELQVVRARQAVQEAQGNVRMEQAEVNSYLGQPLEWAVRAGAWIEPQFVAQITRGETAELLLTSAELTVAEAQVRSASRLGKPTLSAGIAGDIWSLDRDMVRGDNFGFQVSFSMPLFDRGSNRFALEAAQSSLKQAESLVGEARRRSDLAFAKAKIAVQSAQEVLDTYEGGVLPQGESMVTSMREGYESGLVTLIEVLEAQQALNRLRDDQTEARNTLRLSQLMLLKAASRFPGMEERS